MNGVVSRHRFTIEDFFRLHEIGVLQDHDRVELLDGQVNLLEPVSPRDADTVNQLNAGIYDHSRRRFMSSSRLPMELDAHSFPFPDLKLIPYNRDRRGHTKAADLFLVVEVAESSLRYDREAKLPLYARAAIPEYWIVNLVEDVVEVFRHPEGEVYRENFIRRSGETVAPMAFPDVVLKVSDIIAPR